MRCALRLINSKFNNRKWISKEPSQEILIFRIYIVMIKFIRKIYGANISRQDSLMLFKSTPMRISVFYQPYLGIVEASSVHEKRLGCLILYYSQQKYPPGMQSLALGP